jgi:hypothetical protein
VSTAVLDPCAGELPAERMGAPSVDLATRAPEGVAPSASLDHWMTVLLRDLERGDDGGCLACGDPRGLRAAADRGVAICCESCGTTLS